MVRPARTFGDPQSAAKLDADAILAARVESSVSGYDAGYEGGYDAGTDFPSFLQGLRIGTKLPDSSPGDLLVVRSGPWTEYRAPLTAVCRIRCVAYSLDPDQAWDVASFFHASFLAYPGDADVLGYRYELGPERGTDPQHNTPIASFTVRVRMRPAIL